MEREQAEFKELHGRLMELLDTGRDISDGEIYEQIDRLLLRKDDGAYRSLRRRDALRTELFNSVRKLDLLQELVDNDQVTEVMVNGLDGIFIERSGRVESGKRVLPHRKKLRILCRRSPGGVTVS